MINNREKTISSPSLRLFLFLSLIVFSTFGCATKLSVNSEPKGARVVWSPTGIDDWREWPPNTWNSNNKQPANTPFSDSATFSNSIWITVEKDGYYRPLPKVVELMASRHEEVFFELEETPESKTARLIQQGYVLYRGEYVRPEEYSLEEVDGIWMTADDAFILRQRNKGFVEYDGEWINPEEAKRRFANDQIAKGFISYKDRWVTPEIKELEDSIDTEVTKIRDSENIIDLRLPRVVGSIDLSLAQLQIHNSSRYQIRVLLSGPRSQSLILSPYETFGGGSLNQLTERLTIIPGRYSLAIIPMLTQEERQQTQLSGGDVQAIQESLSKAYTEHPFAAGFQYLLTFNPDNTSLEGGLGDYEPREAPIPDDLPEITVPEVNLPEQKPQWPGAGGGGRRSGGGGRP